MAPRCPFLGLVAILFKAIGGPLVFAAVRLSVSSKLPQIPLQTGLTGPVLCGISGEPYRTVL